MTGTIVILRSTYKDNEVDVRCFDSVSACAIYFAHEARRQYARQGLEDDDLFDAVVNDVALLFAGYDLTTSEDPDEVHGGDENTRYCCELRSFANVETTVADVRAEDERCRTEDRTKKKKRMCMSGKLLRVSGVDVSRASGFVFDGCHKIYLLRNGAEVARCRADGDEIHPMKELEQTFADSCPLRFINWETTLKTVVPQFAQRVTFTYSDRKRVVRFRPIGKGGKWLSTR